MGEIELFSLSKDFGTLVAGTESTCTRHARELLMITSTAFADLTCAHSKSADDSTPAHADRKSYKLASFAMHTSCIFWRIQASRTRHRLSNSRRATSTDISFSSSRKVSAPMAQYARQHTSDSVSDIS